MHARERDRRIPGRKLDARPTHPELLGRDPCSLLSRKIDGHDTRRPRRSPAYHHLQTRRTEPFLADKHWRFQHVPRCRRRSLHSQVSQNRLPLSETFLAGLLWELLCFPLRARHVPSPVLILPHNRCQVPRWDRRPSTPCLSFWPPEQALLQAAPFPLFSAPLRAHSPHPPPRSHAKRASILLGALHPIVDRSVSY